MKKFERAEIICNDDDTYTVEFYPVEKQEKGKSGEMTMPSSYSRRKTMTADSLESAIAKIQSMADGSNGKKASDMKKYLSGEMEDSEMEEEE